MKRWIFPLVAVFLLVVGGASYYYLFLRKEDSDNNGGSPDNATESGVIEGQMGFFTLRDEEVEVALTNDLNEISTVVIKLGAEVFIFASSASEEAESQSRIADKDGLTELVQTMADSEWIRFESNGEQKVSVFRERAK